MTERPSAVTFWQAVGTRFLPFAAGVGVFALVMIDPAMARLMLALLPEGIPFNPSWAGYAATFAVLAVLGYWRWEWQQAPNGLLSTQALQQVLAGDDD